MYNYFLKKKCFELTEINGVKHINCDFEWNVEAFSVTIYSQT